MLIYSGNYVVKWLLRFPATGDVTLEKGQRLFEAIILCTFGIKCRRRKTERKRRISPVDPRESRPLFGWEKWQL